MTPRTKSGEALAAILRAHVAWIGPKYSEGVDAALVDVGEVLARAGLTCSTDTSPDGLTDAGRLLLDVFPEEDT